MATRRYNYRLVKIHRTYRVDEIARLFGLHRNTVRDWIKRGGLKTIDDRRPVLILGSELIAFLQARRIKNKRPCAPGEIYCVRCRLPRVPAGMAAEYRAMTGSVGNLAAICPVRHPRNELALLEPLHEQWDQHHAHSLREEHIHAFVVHHGTFLPARTNRVNSSVAVPLNATVQPPSSCQRRTTHPARRVH